VKNFTERSYPRVRRTLAGPALRIVPWAEDDLRGPTDYGGWVATIARRLAYGSVAAAAVAVVGVLWALVHWRSGSPGPGFVVSVVGCLAGFALGLVAEAVGSDRRDLKIGLAGLVGNVLIAAWWAFIAFAAWTGS
jgi:hypothetical protein